jgi:hypothetical protein
MRDNGRVSFGLGLFQPKARGISVAGGHRHPAGATMAAFACAATGAAERDDLRYEQASRESACAAREEGVARKVRTISRLQKRLGI